MNTNATHEKYIKEALKEARKAHKKAEAPIGCVIVKDGQILSRGHNLRQSKQDVTLHAELIAIRKACRKLKSWRLEDCDLYVTLEPCYMCAGAIIQARVRHVYFGAADPKAGAVVSQNHLFELPHNHTVMSTGGIAEEECSQILTDFFKTLREHKKLTKESPTPPESTKSPVP